MTTQPAEALLPWTEQHLKSALINLIEASKNSVRGPERGGSENAVSGIYQQIVAAWNTRAAPKPEVSADDEATVERVATALYERNPLRPFSISNLPMVAWGDIGEMQDDYREDARAAIRAMRGGK